MTLVRCCRRSRAGHQHDALFTNSTLAVDPDTGRLAWYFQHFPNDQWTWTGPFERQLVDMTIDGNRVGC